MKIRAVVFDMGNTLIKYDYESPEEIFRRILLSLNITKSLDDIKKAFLSAKNEARDVGLLSHFGRMECEEYWDRWDSLVLKQLGMAEHVELGKIVQSKWFDFVDCTFYPEVREVLLELRRRGLKVGLISNGYEEEIAFVVEKAGLEKTTFDIIVGVDTTKKTKPDPDIFKYAIDKLEVKPEETIFVGDNVEVDYRGARAVRMHAILIEREDKSTDDISCLERVRSLQEIFKFIE